MRFCISYTVFPHLEPDIEQRRKKWKRTKATNLLCNGQSGSYYAGVKCNGKEKWRTLETKAFSVAKLKPGDVESDERSKQTW